MREEDLCVPYMTFIAAPDSNAPLRRSQEMADHVGRQSSGCGDPMVQKMVAADNSVRPEGAALACDDFLSSVALQWAKEMCECVPCPRMLCWGGGRGCKGGVQHSAWNACMHM